VPASALARLRSGARSSAARALPREATSPLQPNTRHAKSKQDAGARRGRPRVDLRAGPGLAGRVSEPTFSALGIAVVTVSDTRDLETDTSGALLVQLLTTAGHSIVERHLVRDELLLLRDLFARLRDAPAVQVVIATGGTGLTARDVTPEALEPLVTKPIVGFGELFRSLSYAEIGTSTIQSRALGALCGKTLFFLLPGSRPAVRLAMDQILLAQLDGRTRPCNFAELLPRF